VVVFTSSAYQDLTLTPAWNCVANRLGKWAGFAQLWPVLHRKSPLSGGQVKLRLERNPGRERERPD
jgi:hypothetical protein